LIFVGQSCFGHDIAITQNYGLAEESVYNSDMPMDSAIGLLIEPMRYSVGLMCLYRTSQRDTPLGLQIANMNRAQPMERHSN